MASFERTPDEWRDEIETGLEYRRKFGLEDIWGKLESIYYNVHESMTNDGPNIFLSQGDAMLSSLTVPSPYVEVEPRIPEAVDKAPLLSGVDNALMEDMRLQEEVEKASLHAYLWGRGFIKVGYDSEFGYDPSFDIMGDAQLGMTLTQFDSKGRRLIEYDSQVKPGMPWARAVLPHDIVVPWGTMDINTAPWIAHRLVRHVDDIKADRKYSNTKGLQPQISMEDFVNSYRSSMRTLRRTTATQEAEFIEFYEIHDRESGRIYCVTWDSDKFLRNQTNALQIENKLPFAGMSFVPRARAFWVTPDVYYLFYIQTELSDTAVQRTKQRRLSVLKFLFDEEAIGPEELQKLLSPDVGAAAKIEAGGDITKAVMRLDNSPNQTLAQEEELLRANAREQIGFSRNQLGEYTGGRKTATEVGVVEKSSNLRMTRRGKAVKTLYEDSLQLINGIIFNHWTSPRAVRILGPTQGQQWMKLNGPFLKSKYSYKVSLIDEEEAKQDELQALQLYGTLAQDPGVDPIALRMYLTNRFRNPAFGRIFNADIRAQMLQRAVLEASGDLQPQGGGGRQSGPPQMQQLQRQNGQGNLTP